MTKPTINLRFPNNAAGTRDLDAATRIYNAVDHRDWMAHEIAARCKVNPTMTSHYLNILVRKGYLVKNFSKKSNITSFTRASGES